MKRLSFYIDPYRDFANTLFRAYAREIICHKCQGTGQVHVERGFVEICDECIEEDEELEMEKKCFDSWERRRGNGET